MSINSQPSLAELERRLDAALLALELNPRSKAIAATVEKLQQEAAKAKLAVPGSALRARITYGLAAPDDLQRYARGSDRHTRQLALGRLRSDHPQLAAAVEAGLRRLFWFKAAAVAAAVAVIAGAVVWSVAAWHRHTALADYQFEMGFRLALERDERAVQAYARAAAQGHAAAAYRLARLYERGELGPALPGEALRLYRQALSASGNLGPLDPASRFRAGLALARLLLALPGGPPDAKELQSLLPVVAEDGNAKDFSAVADFYATGKGLPRDEVEALKWDARATRAGDRDAAAKAEVLIRAHPMAGVGFYRQALATPGAEGSSGNPQRARMELALARLLLSQPGGPPDAKEFAGLLPSLAKGGTSNDFRAVAELYATGTALPRDVVEALKWYVRAAHSGDPEAPLKTAALIQAEPGAGVRFYRQALEATSADEILGGAARTTAELALARLLLSQREGPSDAKELERLLPALADGASGEEARLVAERYEQGKGLPQDPVAARRWYLRGADRGDARCRLMLGLAYKDGRGTERDVPKAVSLLESVAGLPSEPGHINREVRSLNLSLIWVPAGSFLMGSKDGFPDEQPLTRVTLTRDFWLGKTEVTQDQWRSLMGENPSRFSRYNSPVERVSWSDAMAFCRKLTEAEQVAGRLPQGYVFSLPTEAQWEYACRGNGGVPSDDELHLFAWFKGNSLGSTHPVGFKDPNAAGFCDMLGNVWEWCLDWKGDYPGGSAEDPAGPASGSLRVVRGGGWNADLQDCRPTRRGKFAPDKADVDLGFRVALSPERSSPSFAYATNSVIAGEAARYLGDIYHAGEGVKKNLFRALLCYRRAIENSNPEAVALLQTIESELEAQRTEAEQGAEQQQKLRAEAQKRATALAAEANRSSHTSEPAAGLGSSLATSQPEVSAQNANAFGTTSPAQSRLSGSQIDPALFQQRMLDLWRRSLGMQGTVQWQGIEPYLRNIYEALLQCSPARFHLAVHPSRTATWRLAGEPDPAATALQEAAKRHASDAELQAAITAFRGARAASQTALENAQLRLRRVLSTKQEAAATTNGLFSGTSTLLPASLMRIARGTSGSILESRLAEFKRNLEPRDEAEWSRIEPLTRQVLEASRQTMLARSLYQPPDPAYTAVVRALEADASEAKLRRALDAFASTAQERNTRLQETRDALLRVLSPRQTAVALLWGVL